ncbi:cyd operon YbgE family protein [Halomonas campaniensis]|uniref:cyd operon YbgE family protein n=1 Tax=Halomonas campaniensis TaxID=213554 RepID=UPI003564DC40
MRREMSLRHPAWREAVPLLVAAGLAVWLLLQPQLVSDLAMPLRLPVILLGVWSLGAAFMRPLGLVPRRHWQRRATSPPLSLAALALFTLVLLVRAAMI